MAKRSIFLGAIVALFAACSSGGAEPTLVAMDLAESNDNPVVVGGTQTGASSASPTDELPPQELDVVTEPTDPLAVMGPEGSDKVPLVIFDTDIGPDVDDVVALGMLHGYQTNGQVEIGAVTVSRNSPKGAEYSDAVNTFYGRPDIPIGIYRGGTDKPYDENRSFLTRASSWDSDVANDSILDGYRVIREILADNAGSGRKILIVVTGFAGTASAVINSGGDDISPKSGLDLINENDTVLVYAAGSMSGTRKEFNIVNDISSAQNLFANWPGPMVVSPFEIGDQIFYPYASIQNDFNWVDRHPVREAYEHRDLDWHQDAPPYYNMRSWDLTAVLQAIEPSADYFFVKNDVALSINGDGTMSRQDGQGTRQLLDRNQDYSDEKRQRIVNRMIELTRAQP